MRFVRICLLCFSFSFIGCTERKEILHISPNFAGHIVIFYSQKKERGHIIKKSNNYSITVPSDGIVFTKKKYNETDIIVLDQNGIDKPITGHAGTIFKPSKIDYLVCYIGDSLERKKMKYLDYISLEQIYIDNLQKINEF